MGHHRETIKRLILRATGLNGMRAAGASLLGPARDHLWNRAPRAFIMTPPAAPAAAGRAGANEQESTIDIDAAVPGGIVTNDMAFKS